MKTSLFTILSAASAVAILSFSSCACDGECSGKSEEAASSDTEETYYGSVIETTDVVDAKSIREQLTTASEVNVRMEGTVVSTCGNKGCWMDVASGEDTVFVKFKDYEFFVPTEGVEGYRTVIEGVAFYDTVTVASLRHYAMDAGKSEEEIAAITEPEFSLQFTATGVMMEDGE